MSKEIIINNDAESLDAIETTILEDILTNVTQRNKISTSVSEYSNQTTTNLYKRLSELEGREITPENIHSACKASIYTAFDEAYGTPGDLIQPSHKLRKFYLIKLYPEAEDLIPRFDPEFPISKFFAGVAIRTNEILREFSAENTEKAFKGDLVYWQGWLAAIGFDFETPITTDHIKLFAIQHAEGLPEDIDQKLVYQRYKQSPGTHQIATIKRRLASLSVALELKRWPNPTKDKEFRRLMEKLTKKYGDTKKKGKAITRDILFAILDTCNKGTLIDIRDRALILFGWASGGRRRSEISEAELKDLQAVGENFIYYMPKSKTDQEGKGKNLPVNGMAADALKTWLQRSGITDGKIFRSVSKARKVGDSITPVDINRIIKRRCKMAGYDPKLYSAHSLRSGFITEAGRQRCPIGDAMELSNHKSISIAMGYYQAGSVTNNGAANLV